MLTDVMHAAQVAARSAGRAWLRRSMHRPPCVIAPCCPQAEAIYANPTVFAHLVCAEALGIPCHVCFTSEAAAGVRLRGQGSSRAWQSWAGCPLLALPASHTKPAMWQVPLPT
jgi:hypothetical protein